MTSLFHSESIKKFLTSNQLADLDSVFSCGETSYNRHTGRCVKSVEVTDENGYSCKLFLKLYWGRKRLWPRMTDIKTGQVFTPLAEREWNGLQTITDLGLNSAQRMALFSEGKLYHRSAIIIKEVPAPHSVFEMVKNGTWDQLSRTKKSLLIDKMLDTIQSIHSAGYAWRSTSCKHFYPTWDENHFWKVWLIDCEGVHKTSHAKPCQQNYVKFMKSMKIAGVEKEILDEIQFKSEYLLTNLRKAA